jgi:hypothetical protein
MTDVDVSTPELNWLGVKRGDAFSRTLVIATSVDADDNPVGTVDVSSWACIAQVRSYPDSPTVLAEIAVDDTNAADGELVISIDAETMRSLPPRVLSWDMQRTDVEETVVAGTFDVSADTTRAVAP